MNHLSRQEQELILDFYFRCGQQEDIDHGRDLIASTPGAAMLYTRLEETLTDLDHIKYEPCPDNLVDLTIARLKLAASVKTKSNPSRLHELLQQEQQVTTPTITVKQQQAQSEEKPNLKPAFKLHHRIGELLATAAAIVLILGILFPSAGFMRQQYYKVACADNLRQIGQGFADYANDNNGQLSQPVVQAGTPYWRTGDQSPASNANTRVPWQLVKGGYVNGKVFICRGNRDAEVLQYDSARMGGYIDFPSRRNISYSFIIFCDKNTNAMQQCQKVIAGDLNPIFQEIPDEKSIYETLNEFEKIFLNNQLREMLSNSHGCKGQNVLSCDTSVKWSKDRTINNDDIYTIEGVDTYTGTEIPVDINDTFLH